MGLAAELSARTLTRLVDGLGAREVLGADGGPLLVAGDPEAATGEMRVFTSDAVPRIVSTKLESPGRGVSTCMIFAFGAADSAIPHFTLDCGDRPDGHAFHLDVLPRVELATHLAYMDEVFEPLSPLYDAGAAIPGLTKTGNARRQYAMMSPWMLVHFADESAFRAIDATVQAYAGHWLSVVRDGISAEVAATVTDTNLAARDLQVRANLFSPSINPVWGRVSAMLGEDASTAIREQLQSPL